MDEFHKDYYPVFQALYPGSDVYACKTYFSIKIGNKKFAIGPGWGSLEALKLKVADWHERNVV
jgi:hypothetical protein